MGLRQVFLQPPKLLNVHRSVEFLPFPHLVVHPAKSSVFVGPASGNDLQSFLFGLSELVSPFRVEIPAQLLEGRCEVENESSIHVRGGARFLRKARESRLK